MPKAKFRTKLLLIFVAALVMQGIVIGAISLYYAKENVMHSKRRDMSDMVNLIDININVQMRFISAQVQHAADSLTMRSLLEGGALSDMGDFSATYVAEYFENLNKSFGVDNNMLLAGPDGAVYQYEGIGGADAPGAHDAPAPGRAAIHANSAYREALAQPGKICWLGVNDSLFGRNESGSAPGRVAVVASTVRSPGSPKVAGVLLVELDTRAFSNILLNSNNTFQNQYTFILDKNKNIVCSNKMVSESWVQAISTRFDAGRSRFSTQLDDEDYYVCGQYNGLTGWQTFSAISTRVIFQQTNVLRNVIIICVLLSTAAATLAVMLVSYTLTRPIQSLTDAMQHVQEGDFSVRLGSRRADEMGTLMNSFDFMTDKISALIREVYQEKIAQKNAELDALKAEINPHFLYNTLDSINWMLIGKGEEEISEVIVALGELMKYAVNRENSTATLGQEAAYIDSYLHIQKLRMEERLQCTIDIPAELEPFPMPKLILQPLAENAIIHGIEPLKEGGSLAITARSEDGCLRVDVADNGHGMAPQQLAALRESLASGGTDTSAIGLHNVDRRIRLHYGDEYRLQIESRPGEGTTVTLRIPEHPKAD